MFENQGPESEDWATESRILRIAEQSTDMKMQSFETCLRNGETSGEITRDKRIAQSVGVSATPSIYVNGRKVDDWSYPNLRATIEQELSG